MMPLEIIVVILGVGNIVTLFAAYNLGRNSGYQWGYKEGLRVADAWKAVATGSTIQEQEKQR